MKPPEFDLKSFLGSLPLLPGVFLFAFATSVFADESFPATRYPFQPAMLTDKNPALCALVLKKATRQFLSKDLGGPSGFEGSEGFQWLEWERPEAMQGEGAYFDRLDLDLDGKGKKQVVLMYSYTHSWRGDNYYAFVFSSAEEFKKAFTTPEAVAEWLVNKEHMRANLLKGNSPVQYYPEAQPPNSNSDEIGTGNEWQPNKLFRWKGRYYFFDEINPFQQLSREVQNVYRLRADGRVELQCSVRTLPGKELAFELKVLPGFASFHKVISAIGEGGEDCGTMHSGYTHNVEANAATARIAYRPWVVSRAENGIKSLSGRPYYQYNDRLMEFLEDWSYGSIQARREYLTLLQHIAPAKEGLSHYLAAKYGLSSQQAKRHANRIVEEVIGNWILVPEGYDHATDLYSVDYHPLSKALIEHDHASAQDLIENFSPQKFQANQTRNDLLMDAVEWPAAVDMLLGAGADPSWQNGLGKTPLMMAAHMNRPDTVRLLLRHGAKPNVQTKSEGGFCTNVARGGRTALMYAAENASPEVMSLLIEAGADPLALDSAGNGMAYYLKNNPRLSAGEKDMEIRALIRQRKAHPLPQAFDCRKAGSHMEKLICKNEVLLLQESEMSEAYSRLLKLAGDEVKQDQVRWVKQRKTACQQAEKDTERELGCLQEQVAVRERYLHNRLAEFEKQ